MIEGLDLNHWRPLNDFTKPKKLGHVFFINKATEGTGFLDGTLNIHIPKAIDQGLLTGAFHYLRTGFDPNLQAEFYWEKIKNLKLDFPPLLDVEPYSNAVSLLESTAKIFIERIKVLSGKQPWIYTNQNTWNLLKNPSWSLNYKLWLASYSSKPYMPKPWTKYTLWQFTSTYPLEGEAKTFDCSRFDGDENDLRILLGLITVPTLLDRVASLENKVKKLEEIVYGT